LAFFYGISTRKGAHLCQHVTFKTPLTSLVLVYMFRILILFYLFVMIFISLLNQPFCFGLIFYLILYWYLVHIYIKKKN